MTDFSQTKPRDPEMIPRPLLLAMLGLVLATLALTTFSVVTGRDKVGVPQDAASSVNFILGGAIQSPVACRLSPRALPATPGTAEGRRDSGGAVPVFNSDGSVNLNSCGALKVTDSVDIHGSTVVIECGPRNNARMGLCGRPAKALSGSCRARPRNITSGLCGHAAAARSSRRVAGSTYPALEYSECPHGPSGHCDQRIRDVAFGPELHSGLCRLACNMQHATYTTPRYTPCNLHACTLRRRGRGRPDQDRPRDCVGWLFDEAPLSEIASEMIEAAVHAQLDRVGPNRP